MHIVVLGGGPAALEAAKTAAPAATVTLVSPVPVGAWRPLATWVWLRAVAAGERDVVAIAGRAAQAMARWQQRCAAELAGLGVNVVAGRGRLGEPGEVLIDDGSGASLQRHPADAVIIATGAPESFPAALTPDGERVLSDAGLATLKAVPASAIVLGDGPVGFELCHILSTLGAAVTWLVPEERPRTRIAPEADGYLTGLLERQGVLVAPGALAQRIDRAERGVAVTTARATEHGAEIAMLAFGRRPDPVSVGLSAAQAAVDQYGQTQRAGVYLVGDALAPRAASIAMAEGRAAALHALGRPTAPADTRHFVLTFMHHPQVAVLGRLGAEELGRRVTVPLAQLAASYVEETNEGFLTLAWDAQGQISGGLAVGAGAAEILAPVAVAMRAGMSLAALAASYGPHPSPGEIAALAARAALAQ
jgi:dihydrolipoamide dehydrogenase